MDMSDFGTGLRAHLERGSDAPAGQPSEAAQAPPHDDQVAGELAAERARLDVLRAELAGREFELSQRESELEAARTRLAHTLALALIASAEQAGVPPPLDELALARRRRHGLAG